jgi:voltage-gated potassium channel
MTIEEASDQALGEPFAQRPGWRRALARIRDLYEGDSPRSHRFRLGLLAFDLATVAFIIGTSFLPRTTFLEWADICIGFIFLADLAARLIVSRSPMRDLLHPATWADIIAVLSFLAPIAGGGAAFLRILRTLRLLYTYKVLAQLAQRSRFIKRNEQIIRAVLNLCVFIFVMTGVVYETQHWTNPDIGNYADALYFTVTALTTTGFGDITLPGTTGRMISVLIMIFGVTLFLRLAAVLFRPDKVEFTCPNCGLLRHDHDAVHCKACGNLINIPDEGAV